MIAKNASYHLNKRCYFQIDASFTSLIMRCCIHCYIKKKVSSKSTVILFCRTTSCPQMNMKSHQPSMMPYLHMRRSWLYHMKVIQYGEMQSCQAHHLYLLSGVKLFYISNSEKLNILFLAGCSKLWKWKSSGTLAVAVCVI